MKKVLVILGSTATGKTDVALQLAQKYNGELVSCDSRQVYIGLDIGTGKLPGHDVKVEKHDGYWEIDGIRIWMYDVCDPKKQFTVKDYVEQASQVIEDILKRGKLPIIVGGTGFYLKALLEGLPNLEIPLNLQLRKELEKLSLQELQSKLQKIFLKRWKDMNNSDQNNPRRLIRAIEIVLTNFTSEEFLRATVRGDFKILKIGLTAPREVLQSRINARLASRIDQGLIEETKNLHKNGLTYKRMQELGLEYSILARLLKDEISENQLINDLSVKISQYAKRQMTWFKSQKNIIWFDITDKEWNQKMEKIVLKWYDENNDNSPN